MAQDFTHRLRALMRSVGFSSFRALSQAAGVSEQQVRHLRRGETTKLRINTLLKMSHALQVSATELLAALADPETQRLGAQGAEEAGDVTLKIQNSKFKIQNSKLKTDDSELQQRLSDLQHEYDRLQEQLAQQQEALWLEFQQSSVQILESLLLQLPTAVYAAQQNPQAPAVKLLPLLRPLERLLAAWGIEAIAAVGSEVPYDPQQHQLMSGTAAPGDAIKIRYTGYRQGDRLLYRAKVSTIA